MYYYFSDFNFPPNKPYIVSATHYPMLNIHDYFHCRYLDMLQTSKLTKLACSCIFVGNISYTLAHIYLGKCLFSAQWMETT